MSGRRQQPNKAAAAAAAAGPTREGPQKPAGRRKGGAAGGDGGSGSGSNSSDEEQWLRKRDEDGSDGELEDEDEDEDDGSDLEEDDDDDDDDGASNGSDSGNVVSKHTADALKARNKAKGAAAVAAAAAANTIYRLPAALVREPLLKQGAPRLDGAYVELDYSEADGTGTGGGGGGGTLRLFKALWTDEELRQATEGDILWPTGPLPGAKRELDVRGLSRAVSNVVVLLCHGGYFAGACFGAGGRVLAHKRFTRYVTRKKQGGRQSKMGSLGSAGSRLRMFCEEQHQLEIHELLEQQWRDRIEAADRIFLQSPKGRVTNELFFYAGSPIAKDDPRLRSLPFAAHRPSFAEVVSAFERLVSVEWREASGEATTATA